MLKNLLREYLLKEEEFGEYGHWIPPENKRPGNTYSDEFIQKLGSQQFKDIVDKVKKYTQREDVDERQLVSLSISAFNKIKEIEDEHKPQLEKLAVDMAKYDFNIPEGKIEFDAKISDDLDVGREIEYFEKPEEISPEILSTFKNKESFESSVKKRRMVNALTVGMATKGHYMFHLADKQLKKIHPDLINLYGTTMSLAELGYWVIPDELHIRVGKGEFGPQLVGGKVRVDLSGKKPKIIARAKIFSALVHEVIKGIMEIMSINSLPINYEKSKEVKRHADYMGVESRDIRYGPKIWEKFIESIPDDSLDIKSYIYSYVINLRSNEFNKLMQEIISGSSTGKEQMKRIANEIKRRITGIREQKNISEAVIMPDKFDKLEKELESTKTLNDHKQLFNKYGIDLMSFSEFNSKGIDYLPSMRFMHAAFDEKTQRTIIIIDDQYYNDSDIKYAIKNAPIDLETTLSHESVHSGQVSKWGSKKSPFKPQDITKQKEYLSGKEEIMAISNTIVKELIKQQGLKNLSELPEQLQINDIYWQVKNNVEPQTLNRYKKYIYLYAEKYLN